MQIIDLTMVAHLVFPLMETKRKVSDPTSTYYAERTVSTSLPNNTEKEKNIVPYL